MTSRRSGYKVALRTIPPVKNDTGSPNYPTDPRNITLTYSHRSQWWEDPDFAPERWHVSADVTDGDDLVSHVGDIGMIALDMYQVQRPFDLLDAEDSDLSLIGGTIFNLVSNDGLTPDLEKKLEPIGGRILILDTVCLTPEWRGFGIGALLTGIAIKKMSADATAAVCYPAPFGEEDPVKRKRAITKLRKVWRQLGFTHFRDNVYVLNLSLVTLGNALTRLEAQFPEHYSA